MKKLIEILDKVKIGTLSVELAQQQVLGLFGVKASNCVHDYRCDRKTKTGKCRKNCISKLYSL